MRREAVLLNLAKISEVCVINVAAGGVSRTRPAFPSRLSHVVSNVARITIVTILTTMLDIDCKPSSNDIINRTLNFIAPLHT